MDNENKKLVPVTLITSFDWATGVYIIRTIRNWAKERNIELLEMGGTPDEFPYTILMDSESAVVFKLKFRGWISTK